MGQQIAVVVKPSHTHGVVRYEANRNLTGMGHESFHTVGDAVGPRPAAVLARLLLGTERVESVHVFGNMITINLCKGCTDEGLDVVVRDLYQYWKPGMTPPSFEDMVSDTPAESGGAAAAGDGGGGDSEYTRRVPAALVERSSAALAKWKANH